MNALVTGGAGYIGSHTVKALQAGRHDVVVVDNLSTGHADAVPAEIPLVQADIRDRDILERTIRLHHIDAVFHFASRIRVAESVADPRRYYRDNLMAGVEFMEGLLDAGIRRFIFSSSAAVYGTPVSVPIDETHPLEPVNPYGDTKLAIERMLAAYHRAYGLSYAALRYFNAAGADPAAGLGERHDPETHLIPLAIEAALGNQPAVTVFGRDYPTPDGTCVRDYIHVDDLADAHVAALAYLETGGSGAFNVGTGVGHSVQDVIDMVGRIARREVPVRDGARRAGDPPALVASPSKAMTTLKWRPTRSSLERIVADAWTWHVHRARPHSVSDAPAPPQEAA